MSSESVKVAVRLRPFSQREKTAGSKCIISMKESSTIIFDPQTGESRTFTFDNSYWSHDGYKISDKGLYEPESASSQYASQNKVFEDLGRGVVQNAHQGYNAALFAYGQTGSGKSYTMVGYGKNKGIVPLTCEELFKPVSDTKNKETQYQVTFSMLEIYNEQVRDLQVQVKHQHESLRIRQHPKSGFYVEGLKQTPVQNYAEIERLMNQGTINRTTAATNMNETSSRSHMVITINFKQIFKNASGQSTTKTSEVHLVDLAGSERAQSTGATGDRLKEAGAINQSLLTLGNVISALAEVSMGKKTIVPYRNSALTKLLHAALGGNSKTIMVAALSPAAMHYEETLSTLRYADRAKRIQNKAKINESPTDKLIRELKEENARLMSQLMNSSGGGRGKASRTDDLEKLLQENERQMVAVQQTWQQRLEAARKEWEAQQKLDQQQGTSEAAQKLPYLHNINEDTQLSGVIKLFIQSGQNLLGRPDAESVNIGIRGLGIQKQHAILRNVGTSVIIEPYQKNAPITVNGKSLSGSQTLKHLDRLKLGSNSLYLYVGFSSERKATDEITKYDYDFFQTELAESAGGFYSMTLSTTGSDTVLDAETQLVFSEFTDLMPKVQEANAISEELRKGVTFEEEIKNLALHDARGNQAPLEVVVRVTNQFTNQIWIWNRDKFINRRFLMSELYNRWLNGSLGVVERNKDPFWDPVEDIFIASCHVWLNSLAYSLDSDDHVPLLNHRGKEEGRLHVKLQPCDSKGNFLNDEDAMVMDPSELLGKQLHFQLNIPAAENLQWVITDSSRGSYLRFSMYSNQKMITTKSVRNTSNPKYDYSRRFSYKLVTQELLSYLQSEALVIELWGTQADADLRPETRSSENSYNQENLESQINELRQQLKQKDEEICRLQDEKDVLRLDRDTLLKQQRPPFSTQSSLTVQQYSPSPRNSARNSAINFPSVTTDRKNNVGSPTDKPGWRRSSDNYQYLRPSTGALSPQPNKLISVVMPIVSTPEPKRSPSYSQTRNSVQQMKRPKTTLGAYGPRSRPASSQVAQKLNAQQNLPRRTAQKTIGKTKQKRRNGVVDSPNENRNFSNNSVSEQGRSTELGLTHGDNNREHNLDVELAKSLKIFFRDMEDVQTKVKTAKTIGSEIEESQPGTTLHGLSNQQQVLINEVDQSLEECVNEFKTSVRNVIKTKRNSAT